MTNLNQIYSSLVASGTPCHSGNFLRALRTIPEASALGLVFTDQNSVWNANVPRLVQSWNRFILHQISLQVSPGDAPVGTEHRGGGKRQQQQQQQQQREGSSEDSSTKSKGDQEENSVQSVFGMRQEKSNTCIKCRMVVKSSDTVLLCNLLYPESKDVPSTFEEIVCSSLCPAQTTPAWCEKCRKYQPTHQARTLASLPYCLSLNAGMDNQQDVDYWQAQMQALYDRNKPPEEEQDELQQQQQQQEAVTEAGDGATVSDRDKVAYFIESFSLLSFCSPLPMPSLAVTGSLATGPTASFGIRTSLSRGRGRGPKEEELRTSSTSVTAWSSWACPGFRKK